VVVVEQKRETIMPSWSWITGKIALGSAPSASEVRTMQQQGITDVLDLRGEPRAGETGPRPQMYEGSGIRYHYVGMLDRGGAEPAAKYHEGVGIMTEALSDPAAKILVHCAAGISRSPSMVYAYLLSTGMTPASAWNLIHSHRRVASQQYFRWAEAAIRGGTQTTPPTPTPPTPTQPQPTPPSPEPPGLTVPVKTQQIVTGNQPAGLGGTTIAVTVFGLAALAGAVWMWRRR